MSIAATIGGSLTHGVSTAAAFASSTSSNAASSKTSLLDKAVRYLLDGDVSPNRSAEEIWLMGVRLPG
jgi:hypothetical protein